MLTNTLAMLKGILTRFITRSNCFSWYFYVWPVWFRVLAGVIAFRLLEGSQETLKTTRQMRVAKFQWNFILLSDFLSHRNRKLQCVRRMTVPSSQILYYTYSFRCKPKTFIQGLYHITKWLWVYRRLLKSSEFAEEYPSLFPFVESPHCPHSVSVWRDKLKALPSVTKAGNLRKTIYF